MGALFSSVKEALSTSSNSQGEGNNSARPNLLLKVPEMALLKERRNPGKLYKRWQNSHYS
jgi:hypothetical protein